METSYEKKLKFFLRNSAGRTGHPYTKEKKIAAKELEPA